MQVAVEYLNQQKIRHHDFGRVPCKGEIIEVEDATYFVDSVIHIADAGQGEAVAFLRVART